MKNRVIYSLLVIMFLGMAFTSSAQDRKIVTGRILNKQTGQPFGKNDAVIDIYAFDTEALAEDALEVLKTGFGQMERYYEVMPPDEFGYYTATLPETGALIFRADISDPILERVNYRSVIDVSITSTEILDASTASAQSTDISGVGEAPQIVGNYLRAARKIRIPADKRSANSRLIIQTYFMDGDTNDTLALLKPIVCDGSEYKVTQERRMGYNMDNDPLSPFIIPDSLESKDPNFEIEWRDTIYLEDPQGRYYVKGAIVIEDYNTITYVKDSMPFASSRMRRPMQFLDYSLESYDLDREAYHVTPRPEPMDTKGNMSLNFLVNQAVIDPNDTKSMNDLNQLKEDLLRIVNGENSKLLEFQMQSISSPDGPYAKNVALSRQRLQYAANQVWLSIPERHRRRVYRPDDKAIVAPWTAVADSLENQGLVSEADDVRRIVERFDDNKDRQWQETRKLPYYKEKISPILANMRTVKYSYKHEELRALNAQEILDRYRNFPDYKSGKTHFLIYQYWELFKALEDGGADDDELMAIYKRACRETKKDNGRTWVYAANKYAVSLLKKGIADTTVLKPHIDKRYRCNTGKDKMTNPDAVVANQLRMYLMSNNFYQASVMANMLPNIDKYKTLKALTMCLGGYYQGGDTEAEKAQRAEWANIVMESSTRNKIVMMLAMNTRAYTLMAEKELPKLSEDDPLTWYFKAVISSRKNSYPNADFMEPMYFEEYIMKCFDMDKKFVSIARADGDIDENMLKEFLKYNPDYDKY